MKRDLQATHEILSLFEKSKSISDQMIDNFRGIFVNIDEKGRVLRGNKGFAKLFGFSHEDSLNMSMSQLFSEVNWKVFKQKLGGLSADKSNIEFELPIKVGDATKTYVWQINQFYIDTDFGAAIYTCMGNDITELLNAHDKVFALTRDLEVAETVQNLIFPQKTRFKSQGVDLSASFTAADISSGDFWWYEIADEKKLTVLVGDVTGHGIGSAMITALVAGTIRTARRVAYNGRAIEMPELLRIIHDNLLGLPSTPFWMSVIAVEIDLEKKILNWWGAAPPDFFLISPDGNVNRGSPGKSSPLGSENFALTSGKIDFKKGYRLVLVSDGAFEMYNHDNQMLGERAIQQFIKSNSKGLMSSELCKKMNEFFDSWRGWEPLKDDVTLVIVDSE